MPAPKYQLSDLERLLQELKDFTEILSYQPLKRDNLNEDEISQQLQQLSPKDVKRLSDLQQQKNYDPLKHLVKIPINFFYKGQVQLPVPEAVNYSGPIMDILSEGQNIESKEKRLKLLIKHPHIITKNIVKQLFENPQIDIDTKKILLRLYLNFIPTNILTTAYKHYQNDPDLVHEILQALTHKNLAIMEHKYLKVHDFLSNSTPILSDEQHQRINALINKFQQVQQVFEKQSDKYPKAFELYYTTLNSLTDLLNFLVKEAK